MRIHDIKETRMLRRSGGAYTVTHESLSFIDVPIASRTPLLSDVVHFVIQSLQKEKLKLI